MLKIIKLTVLALTLSSAFPVYAETTPLVAEIGKQAEDGNALAQAKLAALYLLGREGVEKDDAKAFDWMLKAAKQGLLEAQVAVAGMYDSGLGVELNVDEATKWYEKAAKQGHGASLAILGKNEAPKGSVGFNYKAMRLQASKRIPVDYAKDILKKK